MAYIGNEPRFQNYPSKFFNGDGTAMTVTLDYAPPSASAILVFVSGVRRDTSEYTLNGTSLTFTGTVTSGTNNVQVIHLAQVSNTVTPVDGSVTVAKIGDGAVTEPKLSVTGTPSSSTYLRGDMAWSAVTSAPVGGGSDKIFFENAQSVTSDYTITASYSAVSAGPVTVDSGVTVTINSPSEWVIV